MLGSRARAQVYKAWVQHPALETVVTWSIVYKGENEQNRCCNSPSHHKVNALANITEPREQIDDPAPDAQHAAFSEFSHLWLLFT